MESLPRPFVSFDYIINPSITIIPFNQPNINVKAFFHFSPWQTLDIIAMKQLHLNKLRENIKGSLNSIEGKGEKDKDRWSLKR